MGISAEEILSVINNWNKNKETLANYVLRHGWLIGDIRKLRYYIMENNLQNVALTDKGIYALQNGIPFYIARIQCGIAPNFR